MSKEKNRALDAISKMPRRIPSGSKAARTKFENKLEEKNKETVLPPRCAESSTQVKLTSVSEPPQSFSIHLPATQAKYVELHARSAFSFLEGGSLPEDLIER